MHESLLVMSSETTIVIRDVVMWKINCERQKYQICKTVKSFVGPFIVLWLTQTIDREFEFYEFFSFLKFNEFYEFFFGWKKFGKNS